MTESILHLALGPFFTSHIFGTIYALLNNFIKDHLVLPIDHLSISIPAISCVLFFLIAPVPNRALNIVFDYDYWNNPGVSRKSLENSIRKYPPGFPSVGGKKNMQNMGYTLPLEIQWQRFTELGVGEGSQREVQLHHFSGVSSPHSSHPALTWLILSGSGPREDQRCQFSAHPHPGRARPIDLGGAQPCTFGKTLPVIATQVAPILQFEKTLQSGQWVPFPRELQI